MSAAAYATLTSQARKAEAASRRAAAVMALRLGEVATARALVAESDLLDPPASAP